MLRESTITRAVERAYLPAVSWGAVFAGSFFAFSFAMLLYLLGAAVGVTTMTGIGGFTRGVAIGAGIWMIVAWIISTFLGGWIGGRLAGRTSRSVGSMHGAVVWAISGLMATWALMMPLGGMVAGGASLGAQAAQNAGPAASQVSPQTQDQLRNELAVQASRTSGVPASDVRRAMDQLTPADLSTIASSLAMGRRQDAERVLTSRTNLTGPQAARIISGTQAALGNQVQRAGEVTSAALWVLFVSSLLGLLAAIWGGAVGASGAERFLERELPPEAYRPEERRYRPADVEVPVERPVTRPEEPIRR